MREDLGGDADNGMHVLIKYGLVIALFLSAAVGAQDRVPERPIVLDLYGNCDPRGLSIEYFIAGQFGGYSGFIQTAAGQSLYRIPDSFEGKPASMLKVIIRGARCGTMLFDFPEIPKDGITVEPRLRRIKRLDFRGTVDTSRLRNDEKHLLTVEYWAHWKCDYLGVVNCLVGPNRVDAVDIGRDGRFRVKLPDFANDPALAGFANKGAFQFFIRDRKTGEILYNLQPGSEEQTHEIRVSGTYSAENFFVPRTWN